MAKIIGVISLKGGVGKTSVVSGLGAALAGFGKKVLLVDGNLSAPNLGLHHNIVNPEISLHDVLERNAKPSAAIHELENFDVIPGALFRRLKDASPLKLKDRLNYLRKRYDVIIIDSSPALDDETLGVILASDNILVVTTPDHPTLSNTLRAVKLARQRGTPIIGLILNKVYDKNFELSIDDIEDATDVPIMAVIPHDVAMLEALSEYKAYPSYKKRAKGSEEFKKLAATISGEKYKPAKLKKFFGWVSPKKQDINRTIYYEEMFK
jgi:septum site-determining protein MinD